MLTDNEIEGIIDTQDLAIEKFLLRLKQFVDQGVNQLSEVKSKPEVMLTAKEKFHLVKSNKVEVQTEGEETDNSAKGKLLNDLKATVSILEAKILKMENAVKTKDEKIRFLSKKLKSENEIEN